MSIAGCIIIYVNLWMIIFFMVLPFGITNQIDSTDYQKGTDPGAPVESRIKKKILITTLISTVIFSLILVVDQLDLFNIRKILF
ncbi:COG5454 Predicted secreted protein [Candidatus Pelagibacterales bacterium]